MVISEIKDVIVIGGGPSGVQCATRLHRVGINVLLLTRSIEMFSDTHASDTSRTIARKNSINTISNRMPIKMAEVTAIHFSYPHWHVKTKDATYLTKRVVLATGRSDNLAESLLSDLYDLEWDDEGSLVVDEDFLNSYNSLHIAGELTSGYDRTLSNAIGIGDAVARRIEKLTNFSPR